MSQFLSSILNAEEPTFSQKLRELEISSGYPSHDIRLSESIKQTTRLKLKQLDLDPNDTTAEELYYSLQQKLIRDELKLVKRLRTLSAAHVNAEANLADGIAFTVRQSTDGLKTFALKPSVIKRLLIKLPPKKTIRKLGYRSLSSLLKQEPASLIALIAGQYESLNWLKQYRQELKKLKPGDLSDQSVSVFSFDGPKLVSFGNELKRQSKRTVLVNKECAALLVLPVESVHPKPGLTTATLIYALNAVNSLLVSGSYLKLSLLSHDFGDRLSQLSEEEPSLKLEFINQPLSWDTVQKFFSRAKGPLDQIIDTPIDFDGAKNWRPVEEIVASIDEGMSYWTGTAHVCLPSIKAPVSLNLMDNAYNLLNRKSFAERITRYGQNALMQELILKYIHPELLKEALFNELRPKLASETVSV